MKLGLKRAIETTQARSRVIRAWIARNQGKHRCQCGCGAVILIQIHHHVRGIPRFVSPGHASRVSNPMTGRSGDKNPNYKGGRKINPAGYVCILIPGPGQAKYILEHRLVMEKHLGRKLLPGEVVHHKNGIKTDNRIGNLEVIQSSEHTRMHCLNGEVGWKRYHRLRRRSQ